MTRRRTWLATAIGAGSGAAGMVAAAPCAGGAYTSCFGCAAAGFGVLLAALASMGGARGVLRHEERHGPAPVEGDRHGLA